MNHMTRQIALSALLLSCYLVRTPPAMAADRYDEARSATQAAQTLQGAGRWVDAEALLKRESQGCGTSAENRPCRLLISFSLGYLTERQAAKSYPSDPALLAQAAEHYRVVLDEAPDHGPTLKNLALIYRTLGKPEEAEQALKKAVESDRSGTGKAALLLGNLYRETGRPAQALGAYEVAASSDPAAEAPRRAIVGTFGDLPPNQIGELLPRLTDWESTHPGAAEAGFRQVIDSALTVAPPLAERAVLGWVTTLARNGWISAQRIAGFHPDWLPIRDLQRYMGEPESPPASGSWWLQNAQRRSVLAGVALALGAAPDAIIDPRRAAVRWEQGMRLCPRYEEYMFGELRNDRPVRLELARELLALYAKHPILDHDGLRQRGLIGELFAGKGGAYQASDLEAIQRFHTTLGLIYAERGVWEGGGATNARFQLENALRIADQREREGNYYQPLQDLKAQLAKGYESLQRPDLARPMYVRVAQAYLDTDQLDLAGQALDQVSGITTPPLTDDNRRRVAIATQIVGTRRAIAASNGRDLDPASSGYVFRRGGKHGWLFNPEVVDPAFVLRQQFKAIADLALQSHEEGYPLAAENFAAQAFSLAIRLPAIVGTMDLIRIEKVKELATAHAVVARRRTDVDATAPAKNFGGKSWTLYVSSEPRPLFVKIGPDAVLAGKLTSAWRSDPVLAGKDISFAIDDGRVELSYKRGDVMLPAAFDKLRATEGVRAWTVSPISK